MRPLILIAAVLCLVAGFAAPAAADNDWNNKHDWWQDRHNGDDDDRAWWRDKPRGRDNAPWWRQRDDWRNDDDRRRGFGPFRHGEFRHNWWNRDDRRHGWNRDDDRRSPWQWWNRQRDPISMKSITDSLQRQGYRHIGDRDRHDGFYWIKARDRDNDEVRLKIDPYTGRILDRRRR